MAIVYSLLVGHFVADFICQSDWMAVNKSKRWDALALHVGVYWAVLMLFVLGQHVAVRGADVLLGNGLLWFAAVNLAAHFTQDAITSRIASRLWFFDMAMPVNWPSRRNPNGSAVPHFAALGGNRHWFFVAIGFDQLLHYVTLFVTAGWWLR